MVSPSRCLGSEARPSTHLIQPVKPSPLILASCLPPVPARLVRRIQAFEFIEMRELLPDNIALSERLEALPSHSSRDKVPHQREIGSLLTWVSSFATYVAVISESHPERVADMLMYMRLIVRESQKFSGLGWLTYDSVFRQNNPGALARWNVLDPSLHTAHIVQGGLRAVPCHICNGVDHTPEECALSPLLPVVRPSRPQGELNWGVKEARSATPPSRARICVSWNRGQCRFPGTCLYRHVCLSCNGAHRQKDCEAGRQGWRGSPRWEKKFDPLRKP